MNWQRKYRRWAAAWLDGSDRSAESARLVLYWAPNSATDSALSAAGVAALSLARSAAAWAALSATDSARSAPIDVIALAREASHD
jgi:hypothetical protein